MPEGGIELFDKKEILKIEEIEYLVSIFYRDFGIKKIRFTGGEPLMRRGLETLIKNVRKNFPEIDLNITTNGFLLRKWVSFLKENDVKVNVSLDTLREENFKKITGTEGLEEIIEGIDLALSACIPLKINTVILKGINDKEIHDLIDFASRRNIPLRFIEYIPFGGTKGGKQYFVSEKEIKKILAEKYDIIPHKKEKIAKIYGVYSKGDSRNLIANVGFISTISSPFCQTCSRLRITSDGKVVLCLFDRKGYDLKKFLRPFRREEELKKFLTDTVKLKPRGFVELRDGFLKSGKSENFYLVMRKLGG